MPGGDPKARRPLTQPHEQSRHHDPRGRHRAAQPGGQPSRAPCGNHHSVTSPCPELSLCHSGVGTDSDMSPDSFGPKVGLLLPSGPFHGVPSASLKGGVCPGGSWEPRAEVPELWGPCRSPWLWGVWLAPPPDHTDAARSTVHPSSGVGLGVGSWGVWLQAPPGVGGRTGQGRGADGHPTRDARPRRTRSPCWGKASHLRVVRAGPPCGPHVTPAQPPAHPQCPRALGRCPWRTHVNSRSASAWRAARCPPSLSCCKQMAESWERLTWPHL